jgi:hypothetical protein
MRLLDTRELDVLLLDYELRDGDGLHADPICAA